MYYTYILYSASADKFYVGQSQNPDIRLNQHNDPNGNSWTSTFQPWVIFDSLPFLSRADAMNCEKYLKKKSRDFIQRINSDNELKLYIIQRFSSKQ